MQDVSLFLLGVAVAFGAWQTARARRAQRAAEARALAAEKLAAARGRCLSLAATELRGPGLALMAQALDGAAADRPLDAIAQQMLRIADDLQDFASEPNARALKEMPAPLGPVVDAAVAAVAAQIRPGHRHWRVDPALRQLTVRADRRALQGADQGGGAHGRCLLHGDDPFVARAVSRRAESRIGIPARG